MPGGGELGDPGHVPLPQVHRRAQRPGQFDRPARPPPTQTGIPIARTAEATATRRARRSSADSKGSPKARFSGRLRWSPVPMPAISRPSLMAPQARHHRHQHRVGDHPHPGHQVAHGDGGGGGGHRTEERRRRERRPARLAHRPQVVEAEHTVEAQRLGPAGGVEGGVGLVPELRECDPDLHRRPPAGAPGRAGHAVDSTLAFSSRRAIDMMRLWARILMKPGRGTFISTSR